MPELPEVETVRLGLAPALEGQKIAHAEVRRKDLRIPFPKGLAKWLLGRRIEGLRRRAKYLLVDFVDTDEMLLIHLGMSGHMTVTGPGGTNQMAQSSPHDHVVIETTNGARVVFNDPRRFGLMTLVDRNKAHLHPLLRDLGPEPLDAVFNADLLVDRLAGRGTAIKAALLDQHVVAGLGNIYVCEALFRAGISPKRKAGNVGPVRARRLVHAIKDVLTEAIASGGSTLRDHVQPTGELGYFQHNFSVYGREGEACPGCDCDGVKTKGVRRIKQGGRSTFYCPSRQR
ncbi:MAG: bifunctional DNA-formamidopyrimidine glycosylase/DNA-(apurinic or apyrimidinic site) lyase [Rhodospirillales bacterium]|jgi:formamidopyrimidine-DNA glycosylase|nr:bifunctional DNA-formamidopyrimidine glycosylase/DNA-(apurinic or apyrimidinic site) lyase [Rhodospirillales bacterium]MBT4005524.1 bifunctional DNA-formamidopyrimidine glycosylase/DNA-(apurinic or apyrimidinic site) lyase [Rhodospirillales bacterium]MBT5076835.1 bifunctional DNA-formamidopyrimidine glycosylase/DNA-(apurinic or apyrimidinic site) lyase [Rhodospirillales bacterium]MBT5112243.1 bifunctional DNA-formamidopyrimidine glycosylase/DNA-(apurinic or apyrimidinic site) lyase [Rhodospir